ncbi:efflux RND transporter periplasmic adaptor subunit [Deferribacterales bacterium RsTz2092]|nr:RND transporter [Deferribacterales bacterium]
MRKVKVNALALLIVTLPVLFCATAGAQQRQAPLVSVAVVNSGEIAPSQDYICTINYYATTTVAAERSGRIDLINADEGSDVANGKTLATINADALSQNISAAKSRVSQQKAVVARSLRTFVRSKALYAENGISEQAYQNSVTDLEIQKHLYDEAKANLALLEVDMKRSRVVAPFDGVILKKYVNKGSWVSVGSPAFDIASRQMEVVVNAPQSVVNSIRLGDSANVKVNGKLHSAKVRAIVPSGNASVRTFPVKLDIPYDSAFMNGMDCTAMLSASTNVASLVVPRDAVVSRAGLNYVFIVDGDKAKQVSISVIGYSGTQAGISSDELKAGMRVITRGNETIVGGTPVRIAQ